MSTDAEPLPDDTQDPALDENDYAPEFTLDDLNAVFADEAGAEGESTWYTDADGDGASDTDEGRTDGDDDGKPEVIYGGVVYGADGCIKSSTLGFPAYSRGMVPVVADVDEDGKMEHPTPAATKLIAVAWCCTS